MQSISELVNISTFVFTGTVLEVGASSVPLVTPSHRLITVQLDESLRTDPMLGDLQGRIITVEVNAPEEFETGQRALFFAQSSVHGRGIAVRSIAHVDPGQVQDVTTAIAQLPTRHLVDRLLNAKTVLNATITRTDPPAFTFDQHDGLWSAAHVRVSSTLKGTPPSPRVFYFATAEWPPFNTMPRFTAGQTGMFLLHAAPQDASQPGGTLPEGSLVANDTADFQEPAEAERIQQLLAALS